MSTEYMRNHVKNRRKNTSGIDSGQVSIIPDVVGGHERMCDRTRRSKIQMKQQSYQLNFIQGTKKQKEDDEYEKHLREQFSTTSQIYKKLHSEHHEKKKTKRKNCEKSERNNNNNNVSFHENSLMKEDELSCDSEIFRKKKLPVGDQITDYNNNPSSRSHRFLHQLQHPNPNANPNSSQHPLGKKETWDKTDLRRKRPGHHNNRHLHRSLVHNPRNCSCCSQKLSLYPSEYSDYLGRKEKDELNLRKLVSRGVLTQTNKLKAKETFEPLEKTWESKLVITKRFECFATRSGDHNKCFFNITNRSELLMCYHIKTNQPENYTVLPHSPCLVPSGKSISVHMTNTLDFDQVNVEDLDQHQVIIESSFLSPHGRVKEQGLGDFFKNSISKEKQDQNEGQSSSTTLPMSLFFVHPCSIIPMKATGYHSIPIVKSLPPPPDTLKYLRKQLLLSRLYGERVFERMESNLSALYPQMKRLRRQTYFLSVFLNMISYGIFLGLLLFATVFLTSVHVELNEAVVKPDYSDSSTVMRWIYQSQDSLYDWYKKGFSFKFDFDFDYLYTDISLKKETAKAMTDVLSDGFQHFVQHPLIHFLEFLERTNPF